METKDIIIGVAIGLFIAYLFRPQQTQQAQTIPLQQYLEMQNRIQQLELQLQQTNNRPIRPTQPVGYITSNNEQQQRAVYKNNEKWAITRNKDGFISNIEVIRDAKVS